jgi:hypothetical protein
MVFDITHARHQARAARFLRSDALPRSQRSPPVRSGHHPPWLRRKLLSKFGECSMVRFEAATGTIDKEDSRGQKTNEILGGCLLMRQPHHYISKPLQR